MRLNLVRHCESEGNLTRRFISLAHHTPLTERGRRQAELLAPRLEDVTSQAGVVRHSPALRTKQTAEILCGPDSPARLQVLDALAEVDVGVLEGESEEDPDVMAVFHDVVSRMGRGERGATFEGGESLADVLDRADAVMMALREQDQEDALVVSHCLFLCGLIPALTGRRVVDYQGCYVTKGALTVLEGVPGSMEVRLLGDISHQPETVRSVGGPYSPSP